MSSELSLHCTKSTVYNYLKVRLLIILVTVYACLGKFELTVSFKVIHFWVCFYQFQYNFFKDVDFVGYQIFWHLLTSCSIDQQLIISTPVACICFSWIFNFFNTLISYPIFRTCAFFQGLIHFQLPTGNLLVSSLFNKKVSWVLVYLVAAASC